MSKKTELAQQEGGALAPSEYARPYQMEGKDQDDVLMPRLILHQGDISEKYYGKHAKGTILHSVTGDAIEARRFCPIGLAWKEWIRFGENFGDRMHYRTRLKSEVPPDDLEWHGDDPPAASLFYNFVVILEGTDLPVCLSLKGSDKLQRSAAQALNQLEEVRAARKAGPGLYELELADRENAKGKWKSLKVRPVGNPSPELAKASFEAWGALSGKSVEVHQDSDGAEKTYDPNIDG